MARDFDSGLSQYLDISSAIATGYPLTLACWFNSSTIGANQSLISIDDDATTNRFRLIAAGASGGDPITCQAVDAIGTRNANSTAGYTVDTWHHACGVCTSSLNRAAFLDGGNKGTNVVACSPVGLDDTYIGSAEGGAGYMDGYIAEAAIWNAALTDVEVEILAKGFSPLLVRPQSLVAYWPLIRDTDDDIVGGYSMTPQNGPTVAAHCRVIYPGIMRLGAPGPIGLDVVWGHDTGVLETVIRDFNGNWIGTGTIDNPGSDDTERLALDSAEYMISEVVNTGAVNVLIDYNVYAVGDGINLDYRHGATVAACESAGWNNYVAPFTSLGYIQVRVTSTL